MNVHFSAEKRLVLRVLGYWQLVRNLRQYPSFSEIDPAALGDDWAQCGLLRWDASAEDFRFAAIGAGIDLPGKPLTGRTAAECPPDCLPGYALEDVERVLTKRVPVSFGGERTQDDRVVLYRSIMLPLGGDDETIDGLLIGVNCKVVPEPGSAGELPAPDLITRSQP